MIFQTASNILCNVHVTVGSIFKAICRTDHHAKIFLRCQRSDCVSGYTPPPLRARFAMLWTRSGSTSGLMSRIGVWTDTSRVLMGLPFTALLSFGPLKIRLHDSDGVNLNRQGNRKYYNNIRAVLVSDMKRLKTKWYVTKTQTYILYTKLYMYNGSL